LSGSIRSEAGRASTLDRAGAIRAALRRLVARRGFHGASMSAVAGEAGVATGTPYVHYASKDELVLAAYLESKRELGRAASEAVAPGDPPEQRFRALWLGAHRHLAANPDEALFLLQVDDSPYGERAHALAMERDDDPLVGAAQAPEMAERLLELPLEVLYELGMAPAVRLAAGEVGLTDAQLEEVAGACWRAVTHPH
jgi:AcrR family transcriptional regulator